MAACTYVHRKFILLAAQTIKLKKTVWHLVSLSKFTFNCWRAVIYLTVQATIIQVIILVVILCTQTLSHLHKQQRQRAADNECTMIKIALLEGDLKLSWSSK